MTDSLYAEQMELADLTAGDYFNQEGILCCGKCHTRKVHIIGNDFSFLGFHGPKVVRCLCECESRKRDEEAAARALQEKLHRIDRLKRVCFTDVSFHDVKLENCEKIPEHIIQICHQFIDHWDENRSKNCGLLFWGGVGNGKTTAAAAIANALLEKEVPVLMRNFGAFLNATFEEKEELFRLVTEAGLVVLDDFGMERGTEYSIETVFSVIDARYNSKKPVIITTNLPLKTINNPGDVAHKRSYDRISEMCVPVLFEGESLRKAIGEEKKKQFIEQGQCPENAENTISDEGGI